VPWKVGEPLQPPERQPLPDSMRSWALRPKVGVPQASSSSLVCNGPSSLSPVMKAMLSHPTLPG
jgi:hypothetical protein